MKRKDLTINLGNLNLTDSQYKRLLSAVHTTVSEKLKAVKTPTLAGRRSLGIEVADAKATATVDAKFFKANPGDSQLKAKHKGITKTLTKSGQLQFNNVSRGDVIIIQGRSLGSSLISIDVNAKPQKMEFEPGTFNFNFFIL